MKQKTWTILITVISLSILIALITATIITGNNLYTKIGTSFFGILIGLSIVPDIKKDGKLTWQSNLSLLLALWFLFSPWF